MINLPDRYKALFERLRTKIDKKRIYTDPLHTLAFGTDASFYRLIPEIVIKAAGEAEASFILAVCSDEKIPVTFRAAGTSLSGQAITDSVLVIADEGWKKFKIEDEAGIITLQPGLTGGQVNSILKPYGRKIGPDPASVNSAMIGGIAANNASGMCCGTAQNSYKTLSGIRIVFADGSVLDTRDKASREAFASTHGKLIDEIRQLANSVKGNAVLSDRIRNKYKIKNTTGYSLNALVDFSDPFDIIAHLMIGSEGTLGFISEISYMTVQEFPFRATSLMIFPDIVNACKAVIRLKTKPVSAVELIDRTGLRSVESGEGMPAYLKTLDEEACALLVETTALSEDELERKTEDLKNSLENIPVLKDIIFTSIPHEYEKLWKIRKGLFPSVGAMRKTGTTVIIEDVAFPVPSLAEATADLRKLLLKYGYNEAVIFGHALEGNLHFVFSQDFSSPEEILRYSNLMSEVTDMVVKKYDGSLKAEHGTGRNMAPFVEMEWGTEAFQLMKRIKKIFDPDNILNPGVILNDDKEIHLRNLKPAPPADEITEKCIECGFCEQSCVSAGLTLTPRQRIVVQREITSLRNSGKQPHLAASLSKAFLYEGDQTCATDGLCALACPVNIDCGKLVKRIRKDHSKSQDKVAMTIANNMAFVTSAGRKVLSAVSFFHLLLGSKTMKGISGGLRTISFGKIPAWNPHMPSGSRRIRKEKNEGKYSRKVVYFPSCINRTMGVAAEYRKEKQLTEKMTDLLHKSGYEIIFPENMDKLCCGMAFSSKGFVEAGQKKSNELLEALRKASENGRYPVVCDMSPCLYTMRENMKDALKLYEPVEFILEHVISYLNITPVNEHITVFPVCSMKKMGLEGKLLQLARLCAKNVTVAETNCCGFAGDRGFTFPELNKHGLRNLREQLPAEVKNGYCNSRTCEIGLSDHSGITYKSIVYLVDEVSD